MLDRRVPRLDLEYPMWQEDCLAAISETDPSRLQEKMFTAELAIFHRALQLNPQEDHERERRAMKEAATSLRKLLVVLLGYPEA